MSVFFTAKFNYRNSLEWLTALITLLAIIGVLYTFIIGRHFIIPTAILTLTILLGNLTFYAYSGRCWAKKIVFWLYLIFTSHIFFALFWAKKYRDIFEHAFVPSFLITFLLFAFLLIQYSRQNHLFTPNQISKK